MINQTHNPTEEEHLLTAKATSKEEIKNEVHLRPKTLIDFIGQDHIKEPLSISMQAAQKRSEPIEHVLLYGNPGLGKTTLAHIIASEMNGNINITAGPALEKVGDLAAILSNLNRGDILFIDEIHRINKTIEEVLYSAMEDFCLDIIVGKGPAARTLRMSLEKFTLIGATTKLNLLSSPLRDRFGHVCHFKFYSEDNINHIVKRNANILDLTVEDDATTIIAKRSRRTPRIANRLLKRVRDYAQVRHDGIMNTTATTGAMHLLSIDEYGLDDVDRQLLHTIFHKFNGGPVGLSTLAAAIAQDIQTLETIYEPYLMQIGMLERTPRGRTITDHAKKHLQNIGT